MAPRNSSTPFPPPRLGTPRNPRWATYDPALGQTAPRLEHPLMPDQRHVANVALQADEHGHLLSAKSPAAVPGLIALWTKIADSMEWIYPYPCPTGGLSVLVDGLEVVVKRPVGQA